MPTVAVVQSEVVADRAAMMAVTRERTEEARARGAQLVVFPETWLPGYPAWLDVTRDAALWDHSPVKAVFARMVHDSITIPGKDFDAVAAIARDHRITMAVGIIERVEQGPGRGTLYNALVTIGANGALLNHHRKLVPTYTERMVWGAGDAVGLRAVETPAGRVGGLICWEHWMPLARQALHESGEDLHIAVWPTVHEAHQVACRHYAFEGRCFVVASGALMRASALPPELEPHPAKVASRDSWVMRGGSAVIGPDGRYVVEPVYEREAVLVATLDYARIREESMTLDVSGHYHRPDVFDFSIRRERR